jgi:hypothetical protein
LIPIDRLGEPEEIARAVVFLAANDAGAIIGSKLSINGGQYMVWCGVMRCSALHIVRTLQRRPVQIEQLGLI